MARILDPRDHADDFALKAVVPAGSRDTEADGVGGCIADTKAWTLYRGMDRESLDRALNTAATVPDIESVRRSWVDRSSTLRHEYPDVLELRFGAADRARLDFFAASEAPCPTLMFFHGGFWRRNSKSDFSFAATGPLACGFNVAVIGYSLAPNARLGEIVTEAREAATWLYDNLDSMGQDAKRLYVAGWSAGAHLAAMLMTHPAIKGGVAVSGIYDLEPIRWSSFNDVIGLDTDDVVHQSPIRNLPSHAPPLVVAVGGDELAEFRRQSTTYFEAWRARDLPGRFIDLAGCHHYATLEQFTRRDGPLLGALRDFNR